MRTGTFWETVKQMAMMTTNTCRVATHQGQNTEVFEREQIQLLKEKCERHLRVLDDERELALNRGNGLKPSEKPCEEISHTTSEKQ
ncbi:hypothetical protein GCS56_001680 [Vibrio metschnikovii]|uniref:hypothetical protein n=1 Tax=Vibrio TaxID=662 RepID=UPI001EDEC115|nr:hypothetical protein [Vibrio cincinnatiensis]EKO3556523.1 hypothetical protein [Vibrio metschnikovii]EKO3727503.1 hypothetical protein [Vibrio metschnikovii]EKO3772626.1 hypothetical protein [Vibrio metschnikovii]EKO3924423.1 hypothetical protein [Vibrio metschnikovii]MCG3727306.1 hypothetical protein [Vibrio cincinnatiensis]